MELVIMSDDVGRPVWQHRGHARARGDHTDERLDRIEMRLALNEG
jgi:hypothetical protein